MQTFSSVTVEGWWFPTLQRVGALPRFSSFECLGTTIVSPTWGRRIPTLDSDIDQGRKLSEALSREHCYQRPELQRHVECTFGISGPN